MDALTAYFSADISLWGLFLSSLLGATLLPGGSEIVLIGVLKLHPELFWPAMLLSTLGNTLGGMISFGMGWMLARPRHGGAKEAAGPPHQNEKFAKNLAKMQHYGAPALLLAWAPLVGDALCLAAGWLRLNPWQAALFMAAGKFVRYAAVAAAT